LLIFAARRRAFLSRASSFSSAVGGRNFVRIDMYLSRQVIFPAVRLSHCRVVPVVTALTRGFQIPVRTNAGLMQIPVRRRQDHFASSDRMRLVVLGTA
jgi:hypothetical protein